MTSLSRCVIYKVFLYIENIEIKMVIELKVQGGVALIVFSAKFSFSDIPTGMKNEKFFPALSTTTTQSFQ